MALPKLNIPAQFIIATTLISIGVVFRLLPHEPNFAPIGAIALFGGAVLSWRYALWLPLLAMILSDIFLGFYSGIGFTWAAFLLIVLFGMIIKKTNLGTKMLVGGLGSATIFFIVSNFGVWISSGMYQHTIAGLIQCYVAAIPFFRMTLMSDVFYSVAFLGLYALAVHFASRHQPVRNQSPSVQ